MSPALGLRTPASMNRNNRHRFSFCHPQDFFEPGIRRCGAVRTHADASRVDHPIDQLPLLLPRLWHFHCSRPATRRRARPAAAKLRANRIASVSGLDTLGAHTYAHADGVGELAPLCGAEVDATIVAAPALPALIASRLPYRSAFELDAPQPVPTALQAGIAELASAAGATELASAANRSALARWSTLPRRRHWRVRCPTWARKACTSRAPSGFSSTAGLRCSSSTCRSGVRPSHGA